MVYCNGGIYEGQWFEGKQHGFGKLMFREETHTGLFKNNKFIKDTSNIETIESGAHGFISPFSIDSVCQSPTSDQIGLGRVQSLDRYSISNQKTLSPEGKIDNEIKKMKRNKLKRRDSKTDKDFVDDLIKDVEEIERQQNHERKVANQSLNYIKDLKEKNSSIDVRSPTIDRAISDVRSSSKVSEHSREERMVMGMFMNHTNKKLKRKAHELVQRKSQNRSLINSPSERENTQKSSED